MVSADSVRTITHSIFSGHSLQPSHHTPIFRAGEISYWPVVIIFSTLALYILVRISDPKKFLKVIISPFSLQVSKQLFREDYKLNKRVSAILSLCFILVMAYMTFLTNQYFGLILEGVKHLQQFLFFVAVICIMYLVKFTANLFLASLTETKDLAKEYGFNVFVFCQTLALLLLPFIICIQFSRYSTELFLYPAYIICFLFYLLRLFRGFTISVMEQGVGILYIFLYLCALEILPLLVLVKFLVVNF